MVQKAKFEGEGYALSIVGKNIQLTDAIQNYVLEKVLKVERFTDHIFDILVTLDIHKLEHTVSIVVKFLHFKIKVQSSTDNIYSAIDKASSKLVRLVRRYKGKLQEHRWKSLSTVDVHVNVIKPLYDELAAINDEIEAENQKEEQTRFQFHEVVARETMPLRMLKQDEALMKMELSGDRFMIYRCEEDQKLKVIYRREEDKNFGIIEVE